MTNSTPRADPVDVSAVEGTARDSALLSAGTAVSRATGLLRVVVVGAVLGPTQLGNAFQVSNTLPNLVYYGFLAGSLIRAVVVPVLVRHLRAGDPEAVTRTSRAMLGLVSLATLVAMPVLVLALPVLMGAVAQGPNTHEQVELARVLVLFTAPQVLLYAVAATASAVMYANRKFLLPALAPAAENVGVIVVLVLFAAVRSPGGHVGVGPLALLGGGATLAVVGHAGVQWWGASRCGVRLYPRRPRTDAEVVVLMRRALRVLGQAGLLALTMVVTLVAATRVIGGAVALQIAMNFYSLPVALVATPIGLAVLPRLAALRDAGDERGFDRAVGESLRLLVLVVLPASVGAVLLARPLVHIVAVGSMGDAAGQAMTASAFAVLAVGLVGQSVTFVAGQACYAQGDATTPLVCMFVQAVVCVAVTAAALVFAHGPVLVPLVAGAYAVGSLVGGALIIRAVLRGRRGVRREVLVTSLRACVASVAMLGPAALVLVLVGGAVPGRVGSLSVVLATSAAGAVGYIVVQRLLRSPDLALLRMRPGRPEQVTVS